MQNAQDPSKVKTDSTVQTPPPNETKWEKLGHWFGRAGRAIGKGAVAVGKGAYHLGRGAVLTAAKSGEGVGRVLGGIAGGAGALAAGQPELILPGIQAGAATGKAIGGKFQKGAQALLGQGQTSVPANSAYYAYGYPQYSQYQQYQQYPQYSQYSQYQQYPQYQQSYYSYPQYQRSSYYQRALPQTAASYYPQSAYGNGYGNKRSYNYPEPELVD